MIVKELFAKLGLEVDEVGFSKADAAIAGLKKGFIAFGAAALAGLAIGAAALAKSTADAANKANALAQSTGLDLATLQEYGFAAESVGISVEELAHGMQRLAKTGVRDVRGEMIRLADRFKAMPNDGAKVQLAMAKFGRSGATLIPLLNKGGAAIREMAEEAHDLGLVFSKEDVAAAADFRHELHLFNGAIKGLAFSLGKLLLPPITRVLHAANLLIRDFRNAGPMFHRVTLVLRGLAFVLGGVLLGALIANIGAVGAAIAEYVTLGAVALLAGLRAAAAWVAAAIPVVVLIALMAVLLAVAEDVYYFLTDGDSLIGLLGPKWTKFLDEFAKPHHEDPWWLKALREAVGFVTDLENTVPKMLKETFGFFKADFLTPLNALATGTGGLNAPPSGPDPIARFFGAGSSPGASAASAPGAVKVNAPQFNAQITVQAVPGMSPQDVAGHVAQALDQHFDAKMRQAGAGIE